MKNFLLAFIIIIVFSSISFSQTHKSNSKSWGLELDGGVTIPLGSFSDLYKPSGNAGLEVSNNISKNFAVFVNGRFNFLSNKDTSIVGTSTYVELTAGGRYYLGKSTSRFFLEAAAGDYIYDYSFTELQGNVTSLTKNNLGVNAGIGFETGSAKSMRFIIKSKYHTVFTQGKATNYLGIYAGLRYAI